MKELLLNNCRIDGRYDITELLGRGSYAEIYVARDTLASPNAPHSFVVIKALNVFLQDDLDADLERTLVENFQNEAIALDRVRHPNIISRLGHGTARDLRNTVFHYLVLEYLPGGDLSKFKQKQPFTLNQALDYLEQVCAGLAHAHEKGVIHRDIKPQNLLLMKDLKTVKIADFGVARLTAGDSPITRVGTNMYAPPEHSPVFAEMSDVMTVTELTPAADIYSLAKSAYVLITGESPRRFTNVPISELPISYADKSYGGELLRILQKSTQNNPQSRYQTVQDFWKDLVQIKVLAAKEDSEIETATEIAVRPHLVPQPLVSKDYSPKAPVKPQFNSSKDVKIERSMIPQETPRLVVKLGAEEVAKVNQQKAQVQPKKSSDFNADSDKPVKNRPFLRKTAYLLTFLIIFAGALFITQNYLRTGKILPTISNPFVKPEGTVLIDVNLRSTAGVDNPPIGLVPKGSRVRIVNTNENWAEVDIIQFSRDKVNPTDAEHGWVNRRYIDVQEN